MVHIISITGTLKVLLLVQALNEVLVVEDYLLKLLLLEDLLGLYALLMLVHQHGIWDELVLRVTTIS